MQPIILKINDIIDATIITNIHISNSGRTKFIARYIEFHVVYTYFGQSLDLKYSYQLYREDIEGFFIESESGVIYHDIDYIKEIYPKYKDILTKDLRYHVNNFCATFNSIVGENALNENIEIL